MQYFQDEADDTLIALISINQDAKKTIKKLNKLLSKDFIEKETNTSKFDGLADHFKLDTIIVNRRDFTEEMLEMLDYGVFVFVVDV